MFSLIRNLFILTLFITTLACGPQGQFGFKVPDLENSQGNSKPFNPQICSQLDFSSARFPQSMTDTQKTILALALNISGSFEGNDGWGNISDDFDGQGVSLGLLNQNLGSGSLQPLLIKMYQRHPQIMQKIFSADHLNSLIRMLNDYQQKRNSLSIQNDDQFILAFTDFSLNLKSANEDASVAWARQNLYKNGMFIPQWKSEFTNLAKTGQYISIQLEQAHEYYSEAQDYLIRLKVSQTRSFLMFFDVVVQNGGFYTTDINDYLSFFQKNPTQDETSRLQKILELRLRHVKPQWVNAVKSRKQTIINSTGVVNGANRLLEKEYCYKAQSLFPL